MGNLGAGGLTKESKETKGRVRTTQLETGSLRHQSGKPKEESSSETKFKFDKFNPGVDKTKTGVSEILCNKFNPGVDKTNPWVTETVKKIKKFEVFYKATSHETIYKVTSGEVIYKVTWNENPRNFSRGETDISGLWSCKLR